MRKSPLCHLWRLTFVVVILFLLTTNALGQSDASITRTQCKQWDDTFLAIFNWSLFATFLAALVLSLLSGLLGKLIWLFTAPNIRIIGVTFICLLLMVLGVGLGPWILGLGTAWFSGVDPRYFDCASMQFGAEGLFGGQLGSAGVPAIAQTPMIVGALSAAAILGGILAWIISSTALRFFGVPAKVKGEQV